MRLFIGIKTGREAELTELQNALADIGSGRFVEAGNLHLTLKFLGEVNPARLGRVRQAMDDITAAPIALTVLGPRYFGKSGLVAAGVGGDTSKLTALAADLEDALELRGFEKEARPYRAHITLARQYDTDADVQGIAFSPCRFTADEIILFESKRVGGRLVYVREYGKKLG